MPRVENVHLEKLSVDLLKSKNDKGGSKESGTDTGKNYPKSSGYAHCRFLKEKPVKEN